MKSISGCRALGQSAKDKLLIRFRWMGSWCAVNSPTVQVKAERRAEGPRARRSTKRRGKRSGSRNARKRRRLVTADPGSSKHSPPQSTSAKRWSYLRDHRMAWQMKTVSLLVDLQKKQASSRSRAKGSDFSRSSTFLSRQRDFDLRIKTVTARLVDVMSRSSGDSSEFCRIKLQVLKQIVGEGWESIRMEGGPPPQSAFHAVPPPPSLRSRGSKVRVVPVTDDDGVIRPSFVEVHRGNRNPRARGHSREIIRCACGGVSGPLHTCRPAPVAPTRAKANGTVGKKPPGRSRGRGGVSS